MFATQTNIMQLKDVYSATSLAHLGARILSPAKRVTLRAKNVRRAEKEMLTNVHHVGVVQGFIKSPPMQVTAYARSHGWEKQTLAT